MQIIVKIIGYIALAFAAYRGIKIGYNVWQDSIHSEANSDGNPNVVQLVIYCCVFTFLIWFAIMIPVYIFYQIWWLALIVGGIFFAIYRVIKNKKSGSGSENDDKGSTDNE